MEKWLEKIAIITGASSGIGAELSKRLVREGLIVVGLARRYEIIEKAAESLVNERGKLYAIKADVTNEDDIKRAFKWTVDNLGPISILINNAGIINRTTILDEDTEKFKRALHVNVLGLIVATREAVKVMKENNIDGHIIHINSITGHYVPHRPNMDIYPATKHAVTALTETLRMELVAMESKIRVTSISPGAVDTEIFDRIRNTEEFKTWVGDCLLKPDDIADSVIYVLSTPSHVQVHEIKIRPVGEKF